MKFKETTRKGFGSSKIKSIQVHPERPIGIVALFTGYVQIWDTEKMMILNTIRVSSKPIRSCAILNKMDWMLVGGDDGDVSIYELSRYRKIKSFHAHDDFIRKIRGHPSLHMFLTSSDDMTLRMWTYENDVCQTMVYTSHDHFVMDMCFYPNDASKFVSCSLDQTIKIWSVDKPHCIKTFKAHTSGINTLCFIRDGQYLISGADDSALKVWDFQTTQCVATLTGHTNNISLVYPLSSFPMFVSCSEDGCMRIWNSKTFKQEDVISLRGGRVWDVKETGCKMMVGCDKELVFIDMHQASSLVSMSRNRILYSVYDQVFGVKVDNIDVAKKLCSLGFYPSRLVLSPLGKTVAIESENEFRIYSSLGFRNRFHGEGRDFNFVTEGEFVVRNGDRVDFYSGDSVTSSVTIPGMTRMFVLDENFIVCALHEKTAVCMLSGHPICIIDELPEHIIVVGDFLVLYGAAIWIYKMNRELINMFIEQELYVSGKSVENGAALLCMKHYVVSSCVVHENTFYFVSGSKAYYLILCDTPCMYNFSTLSGRLVGVSNASLFYLHNKSVKRKPLDLDFLEFQKRALFGQKYEVTDAMRGKAIAFLESLNMHDEALSLCVDGNQRFEILLKLGRFDEAFEEANSVMKYDKLGKRFLDCDELEKASECFLRSKNWSSLLFTDVLGEKKYLERIGSECMMEGMMNYAFFAYLKSEKYDECARLLENTPFHSMFLENYLSK